jgi:hypothetical protein
LELSPRHGQPALGSQQSLLQDQVSPTLELSHGQPALGSQQLLPQDQVGPQQFQQPSSKNGKTEEPLRAGIRRRTPLPNFSLRTLLRPCVICHSFL